MMNSNRVLRTRSCRKGFTLIEVLVSVGMIGLLVALLIPAVQASREASRRSQCSNNLRQLGLALLNYESSSFVYPNQSNGRHGFSVHSMILPQLEQAQLFHSINFDVYWFERPNFTIRYTVISSFLCPSNGPSGALGSISYAGNTGYGDLSNGVFVAVEHSPTSPSSITDGLSSTVAFSEWCFLSNGAGGVYKVLNPSGSDIGIDQFVTLCQNSTIANRLDIILGTKWLSGSLSETLYNHDLTINQNSCTNNGDIPTGAWTAGSLHPQIAHSAFLDGHVAKIRQSISPPVWRALATRSGNEIVDMNDY